MYVKALDIGRRYSLYIHMMTGRDWVVGGEALAGWTSREELKQAEAATLKGEAGQVIYV
jgi:hypothetical protein